MNKLPDNFLELDIRKQEQILTKRYQDIGNQHDRVFRLLSVVRGGNKIEQSHLGTKKK